MKEKEKRCFVFYVTLPAKSGKIGKTFSTKPLWELLMLTNKKKVSYRNKKIQ